MATQDYPQKGDPAGYSEPPPPPYGMQPQPQYPPVMAQPAVLAPTQAFVIPPAGGTTTVVHLGQNTAIQTPYPQKVQDWSTGLCDCFSDIGVCLCGCFCHPCQGCQVSSHMGENCCSYCWCGPLPLRVKLRTMLGITGAIDSDCCVTCCCPCLALCQMEREMKNRGM